MNNRFTTNDLEILISTMNKTSLDFLKPMFPSSNFTDFTILIINQTEEKNVLLSNYQNIRVINSFEKGLSKSRNLAIENASKKIVLISDDDVVYSPNFDKTITEAFNESTDIPIITFNHQRIGEEKPHNLSQKIFNHTLKSIERVCSIEIAFQVEKIKNNSLYFDENFGLGSYFETAEEFLFLRNAFLKQMKLIYNPSIIVSHPLLTSGDNEGDDKLIYARAALFYKTKKQFGYLTLLKHLYLLSSKKLLKKSEYIEKFKLGLTAIKKYKSLVK